MLKYVTILVLSASLFVAGCSSYNTDFPPPTSSDKISDIIPQNINGLKPKIDMKTVGRLVAVYGSNQMYIQMINLKSKQDADTVFSKQVVPKFDKMPTKFRGKINGVWKASGTDSAGRKWVAWVNGKVLFMIYGSNKDNLNKLIDSFKYISR